jgi:iron complex outermembrane recepter protein
VAFSTTLAANFVGKGVRNYLGVTPSDSNYVSAPQNFVRMDDNHVPSYVVFGLNANYRFDNVGFGKSLEVWGNISNLFDRDPPYVGNGTAGTNPVFFDTLGRYYKVGIRMEF